LIARRRRGIGDLLNKCPECRATLQYIEEVHGAASKGTDTVTGRTYEEMYPVSRQRSAEELAGARGGSGQGVKQTAVGEVIEVHGAGISGVCIIEGATDCHHGPTHECDRCAEKIARCGLRFTQFAWHTSQGYVEDESRSCVLDAHGAVEGGADDKRRRCRVR
jgi:hypothetical protein